MFTSSIKVIKIFSVKIGTEELIARSQAKQLFNWNESFDTVVLNFHKIDSIGQSFADELFRVIPKAHPDIQFIIQNASQQILKMKNWVLKTK